MVEQMRTEKKGINRFYKITCWYKNYFYKKNKFEKRSINKAGRYINIFKKLVSANREKLKLRKYLYKNKILQG